MKGPASALCVFLLAATALAAPVAVNKHASQSDAPTNVPTNVREATQQTQQIQQTHARPEPKTLLSLFAPSRVSIEKHPKFLIAEDGRRIQLPDNLAGAKSWETPNVLHFLTSLTHHKKQSPFPESSIMKEETSASMAETEPQETIVELETKAERESWTYIPYISKDNVLRFRCVRKAADTVILAVPMVAALAILLTLGIAVRYTIRAFGTCRHGAIRLEDEERPTPIRSLSVACRSCTIQSASKPDSSYGIVDEKSEET
ncbi:hypothetical protein F4820DRAFT_447166 [Hypoxylon rubiginosum]|uniref:Uncharacterized protein n=1 Tax=Hypoxylon rubiginosum TaxID=110542 RepID=A0ACB9Z4U6_9PEZI|nr:hypothetical protein F4820DRAFT_447166 [Hypoxylon rubiginosum]